MKVNAIENLSIENRKLLATLTNCHGTTGGPYLDYKSVRFLTEEGVRDTREAVYEYISKTPTVPREAESRVRGLFEALGVTA